MSRDTFRRALAASALLATLAVFAPAHAAGFTINDSGACASWTFTAPATLTCNPSAPPVAGAPTGCQGTATPNPVAAAGGPVTLGVTGCSVTPTYGAWTSGIAAPVGSTLTVPSYTGTSNRAITANVQACDPTVPTACVTVTAQTTQLAPAGGGGGGGAGGAVSCPGFNTIVLNLNYSAGVQSIQDTTSITFGNADIIVARFTTPAVVNNYGVGGYLSLVEFGGLPNLRTVALSTTACDFTPNARSTNFDSAFNPNIFFSAPKAGVAAAPPNLLPNTTYYFNVKNQDVLGVGQCSSGNCPVRIVLQAR